MKIRSMWFYDSLGWLGATVAASMAWGAGCFSPLETGDDYEPPPPECDEPADCSHLVAAGDPCLAAHCGGGACQVVLVASADCQCQDASECAPSGACAAVSCVDYQCLEEISGSGPSESQVAGDCSTIVCDGSSPDPVEEEDPLDLPDDGSECTLDSCGPDGPTSDIHANGTACSGGVCFLGSCMACSPQDPSACGGEGPDEPANDSGTTPTSFTRYGSACGFLDGSDIDWYTFFAEDETFGSDILDFEVWSTAETLELCAYISCQGGGTPGGGCSNKIPGPEGSVGCCWSGPPDTLSPSWDLDCSGTTEDSGTVRFSVRAPGGDACDTYALTADY
jgi:hypothetical protein